jgi:hypothetical protein
MTAVSTSNLPTLLFSSYITDVIITVGRGGTVSYLRLGLVKRQSDADNDPQRALALVLRQIHIIPDGLREDVLGLGPLLPNVVGGIQASSDHVVARQVIPDTQKKLFREVGDTPDPQLPPFTVETAEVLVKEACLQLQPLAEVGVRVEALLILHESSTVSLRLHLSGISRSRYLKPLYLGRPECCLREIQILTDLGPNLMASILE